MPHRKDAVQTRVDGHPCPSEDGMMFMTLSVVLQLATLTIQGFQYWLDACRRSLCPGCSSTRGTLPARERGAGELLL